jgi:predicted nucleic-acid-binding protein
MIGLDTNILVRLFAGDDDRQWAAAVRLVDEDLSRDEPGFVNQMVLIEFFWTMRRSYRWDGRQAVSAIRHLTEHPHLRIDGKDVVRDALALSLRMRLDFPDALIGLANRTMGCASTRTFDRNAARADIFNLLEA